MRKLFKIVIIFSVLVALFSDSSLAKKKKKKPQVSVSAPDSDCYFDIPKDVPKNEPVYLKSNVEGNLEILHPNEPRQRFQIDDEITLFCPTKNNKFTQDSRNLLTLNCKEGHLFTNNNSNLGTRRSNVELDITTLNCTKKVTADLEETDQECAETGKLYKIGFKLEQKFHKVFEICYDSDKASVVFTKHVINGRGIKYNIKESERRSFSSTGTPKGIKVNQLYTRQHQSKLFKNQLGIELDEQDSKNAPYFLARGHLSPDADFIFTSEQFSTYFYLNVAPQFQILNSGNWLKVERLARKMAENLRVDLEVETGIFGVLKLKDRTTGEDKEIYLDYENKRLPVPAWFYKILFNPLENSGIVFITSNNAYIESKEELKEICVNICKDAGIASKKNTDDVKKGYTYCCELGDFRKSVHHHISRNYKQIDLLKIKNIKF